MSFAWDRPVLAIETLHPNELLGVRGHQNQIQRQRLTRDQGVNRPDGASDGFKVRQNHTYCRRNGGIPFTQAPTTGCGGNGVAERFIRTLKENVLWVRSFETIEELRLALLAFKRTYNKQWMLEKYDYRSPAQVRRDLVGLDAAA